MSKLDFSKLSQVVLTRGTHADPAEGRCIMDTVNWLTTGKMGDHPECVCPVIAAFIRPINDFLPDDQRQRLVPYLLRFSGTVSKEHEQQRAEYLAWKSVTVFAPLALEAADLQEAAEKLRALPQNTSMQELEDAADAARAACAAWDAARAARAADAARAACAAWTADAARAACAAWAAWAADAARAAAWAAMAAENKLYDAVFQTIDGVLAIGPSGGELPVEAPRRLVNFLEKQKERVSV